MVDVDGERAVAEQRENIGAQALSEQSIHVLNELPDVNGVEALLDVELDEAPLGEGLKGAAEGVEVEEGGEALLDVPVAGAGEAGEAAVVGDEPLEAAVQRDVAVVAVGGLLGAGVGDAAAADQAAFVVHVLGQEAACNGSGQKLFTSSLKNSLEILLIILLKILLKIH